MSRELCAPVRGQRWVVGGLLGLFLAAGASSLRLDSAVFDETAHLPAGLTYLDRGDFRLNPEHPPLFKMWAAVPGWIAGTARPDYSTPDWRGRPIEGTSQATGANQWRFGYELLNGPIRSVPRQDPRRLLVPARTMMLVPGLLLGLVVYGWARELWGPRAALLSLSLYCLCPTMLAHTRLVTTDLPVALAFTATAWTAWRFQRRPGWLRALALAAAFALALAIKFSALLLVPVLALLGALWIAWPGTLEPSRALRLRWTAAAALVAALVAWAGLWSVYGFRFRAATDAEYVLDEAVVGPARAGLDAPVIWAERHHWVPEAYAYGLRYFLGGAARRLSYLNGREFLVGRWYYFPEALLLKTPPATLGLGAWMAWVGLTRRRWASIDSWFLVLPPTLLLGVSMASDLNIGHRHLAPLYPPLYVALGGLVRVGAASRRGTALLGVLVAGCAASFAAASPDYLSYFNAFAGGPAGGARYLLDSNLDWGQDLPRLRRWMERNGVGVVSLAYFGTADPAAYGIAFRKVLLVHDFHPELPPHRPLGGEFFAISENLLHGLYQDADHELAEALLARRWIEPERIRAWLRMRDEESGAGRDNPSLAEWLVREGAVEPERIEQLRPELLSTWIADVRRNLRPVGRAGDSIQIFRIP